MISIKFLSNIITSIRIIGALLLLCIKPLSFVFLVIYMICGISDVLDGYLARKMKCTSKNGALLDSIADFIFDFSVIIVFIPMIKWEYWMFIWTGLIIIIRFASLIIGFIKYRELSFLHIYSNKITGLLLFCFPLLYNVLNLHLLICILGTAATLSALEEMIINIISKELVRDVKSIFQKV